jgi:hypothetical protein
MLSGVVRSVGGMDEHPAPVLLMAVTRLFDEAGDLSLVGLSGSGLEMLIEGQWALCTRMGGQLAESIDQALAVDRPGELGAASPVGWLRGRFGMSPRSAGRLLREVADLRAAPVAARAVRAGVISWEAAVEIGHAVAALPVEVGAELRAEGAEVLLGFAVGRDGPALDAGQLRFVGRHLHEVLDPEAADELLAARLDREEAAVYRRRFLSLVDDGMGGVRIRGLVTAEAGAVLRAVLGPLAAPAPARAVDGEGRADTDAPGDGAADAAALTDSPTAADAAPTAPSGHPRVSLLKAPGAVHDDSEPVWVGDERTAGQRLADALVEAGQRLLTQAGLPSAAGERPQLVVTVDYDRLAAGVGVGRLGDGEDLSAGVVRRLACDAAIIPAVLGSDSQPLDLGRSVRTASPAQRRMLALRDGGCVRSRVVIGHPAGVRRITCSTGKTSGRRTWATSSCSAASIIGSCTENSGRSAPRATESGRCSCHRPGSTPGGGPGATTSTTPATSSAHPHDRRPRCAMARVVGWSAAPPRRTGTVWAVGTSHASDRTRTRSDWQRGVHGCRRRHGMRRGGLFER